MLSRGELPSHIPKETLVKTNRLVLALVLALLTVRCTDDRAVPPGGLGPSADVMTPEDAASHTLHQDAGAPALETYQLSFWVSRDKATDVRVNYLPAAGQRDGDRFLQFKIPERGIAQLPGGEPLGRHDSVEITLTIDPVLLSVDFEPSGLIFKQGRSAATLTIWYGHADPDLNGDGVVDATDWQLASQIAIWHEGKHKVKRMRSENDWFRQKVTGKLPHFSEYAVSW
jgi:hypothetical protein